MNTYKERDRSVGSKAPPQLPMSLACLFVLAGPREQGWAAKETSKPGTSRRGSKILPTDLCAQEIALAMKGEPGRAPCCDQLQGLLFNPDQGRPVWNVIILSKGSWATASHGESCEGTQELLATLRQAQICEEFLREMKLDSKQLLAFLHLIN